jgi:hypothetical protein
MLMHTPNLRESNLLNLILILLETQELEENVNMMYLMSFTKIPMDNSKSPLLMKLMPFNKLLPHNPLPLKFPLETLLFNYTHLVF